jgi:DNA mismatch repair ATPase MutL
MRHSLPGISALALIVGMGSALAQTAPSGGGSAAPSPGDSGRQLQTTPPTVTPDRSPSRERSSQQQTAPGQRQEAPPARADTTPSTNPGQPGQPNSPSRAQSPSDRSAPQQAQPSTTPGQPNSPSRAQSPSDRSAPQQAQPSTTPSQTSPGGTARTGGVDTTVTGSIQSNPEQATRLRQSVEQARIPEARVDVRVTVGATLPRTVTLVAPPPALIEIAPRYRDYRVVRVRDELVIVEPGTYRIVEVVRLSGGRTGQSNVSGTLTLTRQQQEIVRRHARQARVTSSQRIEFHEGRPLAAEVELHTLPAEVFAEVPELREYRYVVSGDQIVIVNPQTRVVTEVIR